ncbi:MAG TPA: PIG-L family deacetylase [Acidimicrobiales bacterium]|nr:PIG-L family deacetylase [Acidimicrobiales bacterium]
MAGTALHVAPHPDDEILGCGATLLALRHAGWRVVNLTCSLGRPADHDRRRAELERARLVLGIDGLTADPPVAMSRGDDLAAAESRLAQLVAGTAGAVGADLILSPHPDDGHPAHAATGRAVERCGAAARWWAWGLWRDLPAPNRYVPFGFSVLDRLLEALDCHAGELERQPYDQLLITRARASAILGAERVFGFGSGPASSAPFAELLQERAWSRSGWETAPDAALGVHGAPGSQ